MRLNWPNFKRTKYHLSIEEAEAERNPAKVRKLSMKEVDVESLCGRLRQFTRLESLQFGWCPSLKDCFCRDTNLIFSPELRSEILELHNLKSFTVLNTPIREFPFWLAPLPKLESLCVRGTEIREIPAEIKLFSRLRILDISNNDISQVPAEIAQLFRLEELGLHSTLVTEIPLPILQMPQLRALQLTGREWPPDVATHIKQHFPNASLPPAQPQ